MDQARTMDQARKAEHVNASLAAYHERRAAHFAARGDAARAAEMTRLATVYSARAAAAALDVVALATAAGLTLHTANA